ncbi:MAG: malto-oligosyltrehalose synthase, partial [Chloroflexi bacterium]|nr:malto-oligosyltrehalose synthase [Chloroflexota bacterium]
FEDALGITGYLNELGISDAYASPFLRAHEESTHGYDICDHNALNPSIGTEQDLARWSEQLQRRQMGLMLDVVPNHMGIGQTANSWWLDVLENGPSSSYASFFDIDWQPLKAELANKVLLPVLGGQYGEVLENGELVLRYENGTFTINYYDHQLPIAPRSSGRILAGPLEALRAQLPRDDEALVELESINTAISHLPRRTETEPEKIAERNREKEVIKRRLAALYDASPEVRKELEAAVERINGCKSDPGSFDELDALLGAQAYRLSFWRVAAEQINYRRFFDVNDLAAIRMERPEVFHATHRLVLRLLREGKATGLRLDHPDGLWNPRQYFERLQTAYVLERGRQGLSEVEPGSEAAAGTLEQLDHPPPEVARIAAALPLYLVVEKILEPGEPLRDDWQVHGTVGYEFLNSVGGLFVNPAAARAFDEIYSRFVDVRLQYAEVLNASKKMIMLISLASEVNVLAAQLSSVSERNRRLRDFTLVTLAFAIREVIAALPIYRTYSTCEGAITEPDRQAVEAAIADARRRNPRTASQVFDFIRALLLLEFPAGDAPETRQQQCAFVMKFQQTTGPVMAKGGEDTAFYRYNRLIALNEVGGSPDRFGTKPAVFHAQNAERARRWPSSMLTTSTHDTKRGEDVRARISVLTEMPRLWRAALGRWSRSNRRRRTVAQGQAAPDPNDEYLLYQTLVGLWPFEPVSADEHRQLIERVQVYMAKASREAKLYTSWINPNEAYDRALSDFVAAILEDSDSNLFLSDFRGFQRTVAYFGVFNSLAQTLLKLTSPGVPDVYQGSELWDLSLVDPDNRRPVDFGQRIELLRNLRARMHEEGALARLAAELLSAPDDGRVKLFTILRALRYRQANADLFQAGGYQPLKAAGTARDHVVAFSRRLDEREALVVAPRLVCTLANGQLQPPTGERWGQTLLGLPRDRAGAFFRNVLTGELLAVEQNGERAPSGRDGQTRPTTYLRLADVLASFPVALLERERS